MIALVAPGQGAQRQGMLAPWLALPGARDLLAAYSEAAGLDLIALGTEPDADVTDTAHAQPLLAATALLSARLLLSGTAERAAPLPELARAAGVGLLAGHSVGEFPAAVLAGGLDELPALAAVALRGRLMSHAAQATPSGMAAAIGGEPSDVERAARAAGAEPANYNGGGQIVLAGPSAAIERLIETPPAGTRIVPLQVAGAFHTSLMASARPGLADALESAAPRSGPLTLPFVSNADGGVLADTIALKSALARQVAQPVRWDACQSTMAARGVTGVIELAPGGVLSSLARRAMKGTATCPIKSPEDLDAARAFLAEHTARPHSRHRLAQAAADTGGPNAATDPDPTPGTEPASDAEPAPAATGASPAPVTTSTTAIVEKAAP